MIYSPQAELQSPRKLADRLTPQNSRQSVGHSTSHPDLIKNKKLVSFLEEKTGDIKMVPAIAARGIALADDHDARIEDLANIVSQDLSLASCILALANSPLFPISADGEPISCLKSAVNRLGFRQTKQMILVSCYSSMLNDLTFTETQIREQLARHAFLNGCICTELSRLLNLQMRGEEFTAGLFHDVGRLLLAVAMPEEFQEFEALNCHDCDDVLEQEFNIFGTNHANVGAWFLRRNQLPEMLVSVALYHHQLREPSKYTKLVALVSLADDLANYHLRDPERATEFEISKTESTTKLLEMLGVDFATGTFQNHWNLVLDRSIESRQQIFST